MEQELSVPDRGPRTWREAIARLVTAVLVLGFLTPLVVVIPLFVLFLMPFDPPIEIRNRSEAPLLDVHLFVGNEEFGTFTKRIARIEPGETVSIEHGLNDVPSTVTFTYRDTRRTASTSYLDYWRNDVWVYEVEPGGAVLEGYAYLDLDPVDSLEVVDITTPAPAKIDD